MNKLIITAALSGNGTTKDKAPTVPYTADEIAADVIAVAKAGAAIAHIHVRDDDGRATMDLNKFTEAYTKTKAAMKEADVDVILNFSTGGNGTIEERVAHVKALEPEMCSFNPGTINWGHDFVYQNPPELMDTLGLLTQKTGTKPEFEIFDTAMINNVMICVKKGTLKPPLHFQFVLGVPGCMEGSIKNLSFLLDMLPGGATWSITGIGRYHMPMMLAALAAGADGIRVGLEDNVLMKKGETATNVSLVERAVKLAELSGREIATPKEAREILGIKQD